MGQWGNLCCYVCCPVSGIVMRLLYRKDPVVRFHARQSIVFGGIFVAVLLGLSLLDALGGAALRWVGAFVGAATPVVGGLGLLIWTVVFWQVARGKGGKIPLIHRWVE